MSKLNLPVASTEKVLQMRLTPIHSCHIVCLATLQASPQSLRNDALFRTGPVDFYLIGMDVRKIFSYLVPPGKHIPEPDEVRGTQIPLSGRLSQMLTDVFVKADKECH